MDESALLILVLLEPFGTKVRSSNQDMAVTYSGVLVIDELTLNESCSDWSTYYRMVPC